MEEIRIGDKIFRGKDWFFVSALHSILSHPGLCSVPPTSFVHHTHRHAMVSERSLGCETTR